MLLVDGTFAKRGYGGIAQDNRAIVSEFSKMNFVKILHDKGEPAGRSNHIHLNHKLSTLNKRALISGKTIPDIFWDGNFFQTHLTGLASPAFSDKTYLRIHDLFPISNPEWYTIPGKRLFSIAFKSIKPNTIFVCNSQSTRKQLEKYPNFSQHESLVLGCRVMADFQTSHPCENCSVCKGQFTSKTFLLAVGTIEPRKNYERLLDAWEQVGGKSIFDCLIIVGKEGWKQRTFIKNLSSRKNFEWHTPCNFSLRLLFKLASGFISASLDEGFDMPSVEARSFGVESALSDIAVHRELCPGAKIFFNPYHGIDIQRAILSFSGARQTILKKAIDELWYAQFNNLVNHILN